MSATATPEVSESALPRLAPRFLFRWEESQDAWVLLYPEGIIKLNPSAGEIIKRCDGQRTPQQIVDDLSAAFPGNDAELAAGVRQFLAVALGKGWLKI